MINSNQHADMGIPNGSRDHIIVPDTLKAMFNLNTESTGKTRSIIENAVRELVKK